MSELRLHRVAVLLPYARFLEELGAPVERGFRQSRLPYDCLDDPNKYVPSQSFYGFVADMAHRERMPYLGFHVGQSFGASCADPDMVQLLCSSPTMLSGLEKACELINRTISGCEVGLMFPPGEEHALFYHRPGCSWKNPAAGQIAWFGIMVLLGIVRTFSGSGWRPAEIGIMAEGRPDGCVCEAFPNTRIRMNQPFSWFSIPAD